MYQKEIKKNNEAIIFEYIYNQKQSFSIAETAKELNLSFPTVAKIFDLFIEKNILKKSKKNGHGVGRKAREFIFYENFCHSIGVHLLDNQLHFFLINSIGKVILSHKKEFNFEVDTIAKKLTQEILNFLKYVPEEKKSSILGIGIAIPGIVDEDKYFIEFKMNHFSSFSILQELEQQLPYPIYIENESNLSAIAEAILGKYLNLKDFCVLTINKNIGSSHFVRKEKSTSFYFKAGRIHHMTIKQGGKICYCGENGCLGSYVSTIALLEAFQKYFPTIKTLEDVFENQYHLDPKGEEIIQEYIQNLASGIRNLLLFSNPQKIIITGTICNFQKFLYSKLLDRIFYSKHIFFRDRTSVVFSSFHENSSLLGAALFPIVDSLF